MDKLMQVFDYHGAQVRIAELNGEPVFVAKDVCDILDYLWCGTKTIEHVPAEWRGVGSVPTPSGIQEMAVLSEQGLYFFLARSDKPKALPFQKWIAGEVLPQLRKTGIYALVPKTLPEALRAYADEVERRQALEAKIEQDRPKVEFAERVADAEGLQDMGTVAKTLGWGRNRLFAHLRKMRVLMNNNIPLQHYIESGYFVVREKVITMGDAEVVKPQTYVTPKGLEFIHRVCKDALPAKGFPGHRPGGGKSLTVIRHEYASRAEQLGGLR